MFVKWDGHKGRKLLTDDVADASNLVSGAIEGSELLHCCSANRVLLGTTKQGHNTVVSEEKGYRGVLFNIFTQKKYTE